MPGQGSLHGVPGVLQQPHLQLPLPRLQPGHLHRQQGTKPSRRPKYLNGKEPRKKNTMDNFATVCKPLGCFLSKTNDIVFFSSFFLQNKLKRVFNELSKLQKLKN